MITDEELLTQAASGNSGSLEALVYRYHKPIFVYIQRMLRDSAKAEDVTQECFTRLCHAIKSGRLPELFRPWFYRIASNLCKDVWRSSAYRKESLVGDDHLSLHSDKETITSILDRQWEREHIIHVLNQLEPQEKELIILRFYQDLKIQEISEVVELPLSTVKTKLYKAYKKVAYLLQQQEVDSNEKSGAR